MPTFAFLTALRSFILGEAGDTKRDRGQSPIMWIVYLVVFVVVVIILLKVLDRV
jgi:hypothetical protein